MSRLIGLGALAAVFGLLRWTFPRFARLPEPAYRAPVLTLELLRHPRALAAALAPGLPLFIGWQRLRWEPDLDGGWLRPLVMLLAAATAFLLSTYSVNRYFGRTHLVDRLLLLTLAALTWVHPAFAAPLAGLSFVVAHQLLLPLAPGAWELLAHKLVMLYALVAFVAVQYAWLLAPKVPSQLLLLLISVQGATYFYSGIDKIKLGWLGENELVGLMTAGVAHGRWRSVAAAQRTARWVARLNQPLQYATVALELAVALCFLDPRLGAALLLALVGFHAAVHWLSGMNFSAWMLLNLALAAALLWTRDTAAFGLSGVLASAVLLAVAPALFAPLRLAWLDARLCNVFRFEGVSAGGRRQLLTPKDFAPYQELFVVGKFRYLSPDKLLVNAWAETQDRDLARAIRAATDVRELAALEERAGQNRFNERRAAIMEQLIRAVIGAANARGRFDEVFERVAVRLVKVWFDGTTFRVIEDRVIREVSLS